MKKGFVFIETITVLMVLVTSLLSIFLTFQNVKSNMDKREFYDNVSDIYKTDMIRKYVIQDQINIEGPSFIKITKSNCTAYMESICSELFDDLEIE